MAKVIVTCAACGRDIEKFPCHAKRTALHFCDKECLQKLCIPVPCQECSQVFLASGHNVRDAKFCSAECRNARNRREQVHKNTVKVSLTCERCGVSFDVRRHMGKVQRYCSQKCSGAAIGQKHEGENNPTWKGKITITCDFCGQPFETFPSRAGRSKYCCKEHRVAGNLARLASGIRTNLEIAMAAALTQRGIAFDEQVVMADKFMVDFKLRDHAVIVQCDGVYWHDRPKVKSRDRGQNHYLINAGYAVLRFTDQEILDHMDSCLTRIEKTIITGQIPLINW